MSVDATPAGGSMRSRVRPCQHVTMTPTADTDEQRLLAYGRELADGVEASLPRWVEGCVERVLLAYRGQRDEPTMASARAAGVEAAAAIGQRLRSLLARDVDD